MGISALVVALLAASPAPATAAQFAYNGGEVVNNPHVYLTFWGSNWNDNPGARTEIREMVAHLSGSEYQRLFAQYGSQIGADFE